MQYLLKSDQYVNNTKYGHLWCVIIYKIEAIDKSDNANRIVLVDNIRIGQ